MVDSNLKFLRKRLGYTQAQLAEKLNIKRSLIGAYEEARAEPKLSTLVNISRLFEVSLDQFITQDLSQVQFGDNTPSESLVKANNMRVLAITVDKEDNEYIELVPQIGRAHV